MPDAIDNPLLIAALACAARGWPVIPIHGIRVDGTCTCGGQRGCKPGKHPRIRNWQVAATCDERTIRRWWAQWPDSNVGIATGRASGWFVLDVDPRHGGDDTLRELEAMHGPLPPTWRSLTGGGGVHYVFRRPDVEHLGNRSGRLGRGLDIRCDGGLIVVEPSRHTSGDSYHWDVDAYPDDVPLADTPAWIVEALAVPGQDPSVASSRERRPRRGQAANPTAALDAIEGLPEGTRNETVYRAACSARARGATEGEITEAVAGAATRCDPPLPGHEARSIAESACRYPQGHRPTPMELFIDRFRRLPPGAQRVLWAIFDQRKHADDRAPLDDARRLLLRRNEAHVFQGRMAKELGLSREHVCAMMARLQTAGLISYRPARDNLGLVVRLLFLDWGESIRVDREFTPPTTLVPAPRAVERRGDQPRTSHPLGEDFTPPGASSSGSDAGLRGPVAGGS